MLIVALARFLLTMSLARQLPKADVGVFNLIISLSFLLSVFGLMGQHLSIVRFFSSNTLSTYNWKYYLTKLYLLGSLLSLVGNVIASFIYHLDIRILLACFILTSCVIIQEYCAAIFRSIHKYYVSLLIGQALPVFFIFLLYFLLHTSSITFNLVILLYTIIALLYSVISVYFTLSSLPSGNKEIPSEVKKQGYLLFGVGITFVLFNQADVMLVAGMISMESLAIYTVTLSIMRLYDFGSMALNHVLVPKIKNLSSRELKQILFYVIIFGSSITFMYILLGNKSVELLYRGKYNAGAFLIPVFCIVGIMKLLYAIPSSLIAATASEAVLKKFLYINIAAVVINYLTNIYLISVNGLIGAAIGAAISWFIRICGAFILSYYFMKPINNHNELSETAA